MSGRRRGCRRAGSSAARTCATTGRTARAGESGSATALRCRTDDRCRCRTDAITQPMPSAAPISSACPESFGPAPITSCSAMTSALRPARTSTARLRHRAAIHAAAAMNVVGYDAERFPVQVCQSRSKSRVGFEMGSSFACFSASSKRFDRASPSSARC